MSSSAPSVRRNSTQRRVSPALMQEGSSVNREKITRCNTSSRDTSKSSLSLPSAWFSHSLRNILLPHGRLFYLQRDTAHFLRLSDLLHPCLFIETGDGVRISLGLDCARTKDAQRGTQHKGLSRRGDREGTFFFFFSPP